MPGIFYSPRLKGELVRNIIQETLAVAFLANALGTVFPALLMDGGMWPFLAGAWVALLVGMLFFWFLVEIKFGVLHAFLASGGCTVIALVAYSYTASGLQVVTLKQAVALALGFWLLVRFYSEGPAPEGWQTRHGS